MQKLNVQALIKDGNPTFEEKNMNIFYYCTETLSHITLSSQESTDIFHYF